MSEWRELRDLCEIDTGFPFKSSKFSENDEGVRLLRGDNIQQGNLDWSKAARWSHDFDSKFHLRPGDIVLAMDRPWVKSGLKFSLIRHHDTPSLLVQRVARLRSIASVDQRFLYYIIAGQDFTSYIVGTQTGTAVPHISQRQIGAFPVCMPSLRSQRAIAEVLGALDDKIAANEHLSNIAISLAEQKYIVGTSTNQTRKMSDVLTPILGGTPSRADESLWEGSASWLSAKDVTAAAHGMVFTTAEHISEEACKSNRLRQLPIGTVVLTARGTVGEVAVLGIPASINQSCYAFIPVTIPSSCLYFAIRDAAREARNFAHGSVFDTITMRTFEHVSIPDLTGQEWLALEGQIASLLAVVGRHSVESQRLAATRDELLPLLMSGKVRVKDAEKAVSDLV